MREFDTETSLYYYRARYYDPQAGRFLREDPVRFAGGLNFYSYVTNNAVNRNDPLGLWQVTIGGGLGLGALGTIGHNDGQWNFGLYSGGGSGLFAEWEPGNVGGGCHKFGASGGVRAHGGVGLGEYVSLDVSQDFDSSKADVNVKAGLPDVGGFGWNLGKPSEAPHGVIGAGEGEFAGLGFVYHSLPTASCGCESE